MAAVLLVPALAGSCISPDEYRQEADDASYGILARAREAESRPAEPNFSIEVDPARDRSKYLLPREDDRAPGPKERLARSGDRVKLTLATSLQIAARNSRDYQDRKETLYLSALRLTGELNRFESQWFGLFGFEGRSDGDGESDSQLSLAENSSFGFTRVLERGGQLSLAIGQDLTRLFSNPADTLASSFVNLTIALPFLRGAGRDIAYENVTQAERDVIYALRTFERFKRSFAVDVTSDYLRLLQNRNQVDNEFANYERRKLTANENRELGLAGRIARTEVERANQAELAAENRWIVAQQNFRNAKDQFLFSLGLPTDIDFDVEMTDLDMLAAAGLVDVSLTEEPALLLAMDTRLDLATAEWQIADAKRKIKVAEDALQAGVDFTASANLRTNDYANESFKLDPVGDGDYRAGLDVDLPFERTPERNAYRQSLINLEGARRTVEETEDRVKLEVRRSLRRLGLAKDSHRIQVEALKVAETNVDAAKLLKDAGLVDTSELTDAQNDLITAQNAVTAALIDYTIARLELFRDLDVLVVAATGIDYDLTERLIKGE